MEDNNNDQENLLRADKEFIQSNIINNEVKLNNFNHNNNIQDIIIYKKEDFTIENIINKLREKNTQTRSYLSIMWTINEIN